MVAGKLLALAIAVVIAAAAGGLNLLTSWGENSTIGQELADFVSSPTQGIAQFFKAGEEVSSKANISARLAFPPQELVLNPEDGIFKLSVESAALQVDRLALNIDKSSNLILNNFSGKIILDGTAALDGMASSLLMDGNEISGPISVKGQDITFKEIQLEGLSEIGFEMKNASGTITWNGKGIYDATSEDMKLLAFSGKLVFSKSDSALGLAVDGTGAVKMADLTIPS